MQMPSSERRAELNKILVVAAHPDDELLGLGGTIRRLADEGAEARAVILAEGLTSRGDRRADTDKLLLESLKKDAENAAREIGYKSIEFCGCPDNRMDGMELLDIVKIISKYVERYQPDTIFTHFHGDLNIDHQRVNEAVLTACRPFGRYSVRRIYAFETPSSTEWNYRYAEPFTPNSYFDVTDTLEAKIRGMECYQSESRESPHPRSPEALRALAHYRGSNVGVKYAEGFMLLREVVDINRGGYLGLKLKDISDTCCQAAS